MWQRRQCLLGKSHGRRSLVGCSPWGRKESYTTARLHFHFSLSCIGEGNGNPLQCSCLENPRTGEPGGLPSMGSQRVGHDWSDLAAAAADQLYHRSSLKLTVWLFPGPQIQAQILGWMVWVPHKWCCFLLSASGRRYTVSHSLWDSVWCLGASIRFHHLGSPVSLLINE